MSFAIRPNAAEGGDRRRRLEAGELLALLEQARGDDLAVLVDDFADNPISAAGSDSTAIRNRLTSIRSWNSALPDVRHAQRRMRDDRNSQNSRSAWPAAVLEAHRPTSLPRIPDSPVPARTGSAASPASRPPWVPGWPLHVEGLACRSRILRRAQIVGDLLRCRRGPPVMRSRPATMPSSLPVLRARPSENTLKLAMVSFSELRILAQHRIDLAQRIAGGLRHALPCAGLGNQASAPRRYSRPACRLPAR